MNPIDHAASTVLSRSILDRARGRLGRAGGRPVRRLLLFQVALAMMGGLLATGSGCGLYNPRHGTILRGDWSLELNRTPWLNSRTQSYDEVGEASCGPGMVLQPPMSPKGCAEVPGVPVTHSCPPGPVRCGTCARVRAPTSAPPPQQMAHSRFHPVPTRPVFTPWNCPTSDPRRRAPQGPQPPQSQPRGEVIPTPAASQAATQPTESGD